MFKSLIIIAVIFSSYAHAQSLSKCGTSPYETKHKDLMWSKVITVNVLNSFQDASGVICAGVAKTDKTKLVRITYRDLDGRTIEATSEQMKSGIVISQDSDLPMMASFVIRSGKYVGVRLVSNQIIGTNNIYALNINFVRNLSNSSGAAEYRTLQFNGVLNTTTGTTTAQISNITFDELEMNMSTFPVMFTDIYFYKTDVMVKKTTATSLPLAKGLFQ